MIPKIYQPATDNRWTDVEIRTAKLLAALASGGMDVVRMPQRDIGRIVGRSQSSVARALDRLESRRAICRLRQRGIRGDALIIGIRPGAGGGGR